MSFHNGTVAVIVFAPHGIVSVVLHSIVECNCTSIFYMHIKMKNRRGYCPTTEARVMGSGAHFFLAVAQIKARVLFLYVLTLFSSQQYGFEGK